MKKLRLFHDQDDFIIQLTNDPIVNILGTKGSGKTTSSIPYISDRECIVVNCDRLLELPTTEKEDKELSNIRKMLKDKYQTIPEGREFGSCYCDIVNTILEKNKKGLIEGNLIQDIDPSLYRGKVIVKGTAIWKSFVRAVKRDYQNEYFMNIEKEKHKYLYKVTRFLKITKRRKSVFQQAKEIDKILYDFNSKS